MDADVQEIAWVGDGGGANDVHQRTLQTENAEKPYGGAGIFNVRNAYVFSPFLSHGIEDGGR
jgi:hypothetical protein